MYMIIASKLAAGLLLADLCQSSAQLDLHKLFSGPGGLIAFHRVNIAVVFYRLKSCGYYVYHQF